MPLQHCDLISLKFENKMAKVGPFEGQPHIAVAVSGGGDSMALLLLADAWARSKNGCVTALTVDHGLRTESRAEAEQVGRWLQMREIRHNILPWEGAKPKTGIQQAARDARYALMSKWCQDQGILHLLLAHNLEDQAETYLMRLSRGSGVEGLAAMPDCIETPNLRILRPLLNVSRQDLRDLLLARGQAWVDDPSNLNPAYTRTRVRALLDPLASAGVTPKKLANTATRYGSMRVALEKQTVGLLAQCASIYPSGYAELDANQLVNVEKEIAYRALSRILCCIGGRKFSPSIDKLKRLYESLTQISDFKGSTLSGCHIIPEVHKIFICREVRSGIPDITIQPGEIIIWDHRFKVILEDAKNDALGTLKLGFLGEKGWQSALNDTPKLLDILEPFAAKISLPAIFDSSGVSEIPHLGYSRVGTSGGPNHVSCIKKIQFCPPNTVSKQGFSLA